MKIFLILLLASLFAFAKAGDTAGFDEICEIYADYEPASEATVGEIWFLLSDEVNARVDSTDALAAYSAAELSNPNDRYQLFKDAAEVSTGKDWSCKYMKEILDNALK